MIARSRRGEYARKLGWLLILTAAIAFMTFVVGEYWIPELTGDNRHSVLLSWLELAHQFSLPTVIVCGMAGVALVHIVQDVEENREISRERKESENTVLATCANPDCGIQYQKGLYACPVCDALWWAPRQVPVPTTYKDPTHGWTCQFRSAPMKRPAQSFLSAEFFRLYYLNFCDEGILATKLSTASGLNTVLFITELGLFMAIGGMAGGLIGGLIVGCLCALLHLLYRPSTDLNAQVFEDSITIESTGDDDSVHFYLQDIEGVICQKTGSRTLMIRTSDHASHEFEFQSPDSVDMTARTLNELYGTLIEHQ